MRKRALALWPKKKEEPPAYQPEKWVQEEEVLKLRLQIKNENPRERLQELASGLDLKRLVL